MMRHKGWSGILAVAAMGLSVARPAAAAPTKVVYEGEPAAEAGIQLKGWGSGTAVEARDQGYAGHPASIKVVTHGYYAGGRIVFARPWDLTEQLTAPDNQFGFAEFLVQMPVTTPADPTADPNSPPPPTTKFVRVRLVFDGGEVECPNQPASLHPTNTEGWGSLAIPLKSFHGIDKLKSYKLKEIRVFGDNRDEFNIGEIRFVTDNEPISIEPLESFVVAVNDPIEFRAIAAGGLSTLKYSWDFDGGDGLQEDATGPTVVHTYKKAGRGPGGEAEPKDYKVTLTVSDISGAKPPAKRDVVISVNP